MPKKEPLSGELMMNMAWIFRFAVVCVLVLLLHTSSLAKPKSLHRKDLDNLSVALAEHRYDPELDLNNDNQLDVLDLDLVLDAVGSLRGDTNVNGKVQFSDFVILSHNFNQPGSWTKGDFTVNGMVEFDDFALLANNFGKSRKPVPPRAQVPEPSSLVLLSVGFLILLRRRTGIRTC